MPLLDVRQLGKTYQQRALWRTPRLTHAVRDVSFTIDDGETFGLVGESGSGKTTTGRCILRLIEPTSGQVWFKGEDLRALDRQALRVRRRQMQMVFQDPYASLNPRHRIATILEEPLDIHAVGTPTWRRARATELLELVGLERDTLPPLSARVQRRPAAAHRHRPGTRARALLHRRRRTGVGAGRLGAGADRQPARRSAAAVVAHVPVHLARPAPGAAHLHAGGRDVPRPDRRTGAGGGAVRDAAARLHAGPAVGGAGARPRHPAATHRVRSGQRRPEAPLVEVGPGHWARASQE